MAKKQLHIGSSTNRITLKVGVQADFNAQTSQVECLALDVNCFTMGLRLQSSVRHRIVHIPQEVVPLTCARRRHLQCMPSAYCYIFEIYQGRRLNQNLVGFCMDVRCSTIRHV